MEPFIAGRPIDFWWYSADVTAKIVATIRGQGTGAMLRLRPYFDHSTGTHKLDWAVVGGDSAIEGGEPPGGDDSNVCPPPPCP